MMNRIASYMMPVAAGLICLHAGCIGGWRTCQPEANDPFQGRWSERSSISCEDESESPGSIVEIRFCRGEFSVTELPFESYRDYWGDYVLDPNTNELTMMITGGNNIPDDADLSGTVEFNADGALVLQDIFLGSLDRNGNTGSGIAQPPSDTCGHILER